MITTIKIELGEAKHVDSKTIRKECVNAVHGLYEGIEYWANENDEVQWAQLTAGFSQPGSYYVQQIKARITRRKTKRT
jgi:hypothetical protein